MRTKLTCKFCHSVTTKKGLCDTCEAFFRRHRESAAARSCDCTGLGYSVQLPAPEAGETIHISIRREPVS